MLESTLNGLQRCRRQYRFIFIRLALLSPPKSAKSREILQTFELTAVQGHPRSSILMSLERAYAPSY